MIIIMEFFYMCVVGGVETIYIFNSYTGARTYLLLYGCIFCVIIIVI